MAGYIETLGKDTTAEDVFQDIWTQAQSSFAELEAKRLDIEHPSSMVPGTHLRLSRGVGRGNVIGSELRDWRTAIYIPRGGYYRLYGFSALRFGSIASEEPHAVRAYRGHELSGDYILTREEKVIRVELGSQVLRGDQRVNSHELFGMRRHLLADRIGKLAVDDRERLGIVVKGILDNIAVAEWVAKGEATGPEIVDIMRKSEPKFV